MFLSFPWFLCLVILLTSVSNGRKCNNNQSILKIESNIDDHCSIAENTEFRAGAVINSEHPENFQPTITKHIAQSNRIKIESVLSWPLMLMCGASPPISLQAHSQSIGWSHSRQARQPTRHNHAFHDLDSEVRFQPIPTTLERIKHKKQNPWRFLFVWSDVCRF